MSIFLGGTGTANELHDYEEGTWTPRISPHSSMSTIYENGTGGYTKVGNKVYAHYVFVAKNPNSFGSTAIIAIHNLPYTIRHSLNYDAGHIVADAQMMYNIDFASNHKHYFYTNNNSTYLYGLKSRDGTTWEDWQVSDINNNFYLYGHLTYFTLS
tara:strand:- start:3 stop:467 length:465 start_codon:yes stop_codon:yes gene_type:complete